MKNKFLKLFIFIAIIFLTPCVFAQEFDVSSNITSPSSSTLGRYSGLEIYNSGTQNVYSIGTRYNGRLSRIIFNLPVPSTIGQCFSTNVDYKVILNMATEDWRNNFGSVSVKPYSSYSTNWSNGRVSFVSSKKIYFTFKIPSTDTTCYDFVYIDLPSTNLTSTAFTGVSNWNLSSVILDDPTYSSGGSGGGSGGTGNQDIINNNTQNTENIINNQNENTSNIIENNNDNTQAINDAINNSTSQVVEGIDSINSQLGTCYKNILNLRSPLGTSSATYTFSGNNITYTGSWQNVSWDIPITSSGYYTLASDNNLPTNANMMIYYVKPNGERTDWLGDIPSGSNHVSVFSNYNTGFLRIILYDTSNSPITFTLNNLRFTNTNSVMPFSRYNETICTSKLDSTTNAINETNDYLKDDSDPNISDNEFLATFNSVGFTDPLNYLLTLPTQLINKIVALSDTCTSINLGTLYGVMITLPCINLENILGSSVWTIIDIIFSVSLLVVIFKNLYDTFSNLLTMGAEKEAKEKFSMPTPMDFLSMILGGDR